MLDNQQAGQKQERYEAGRDGCGYCKSPYITVIATGQQVCRCDGHGREDRSREYWQLLETKQARM